MTAAYGAPAFSGKRSRNQSRPSAQAPHPRIFARVIIRAGAAGATAVGWLVASAAVMASPSVDGVDVAKNATCSQLAK